MMLGGAGDMLPQENFFIKCSAITSEAVSAKMVLESPTCSYVTLQPVKPFGTTEQSCQNNVLFNAERWCELPGRFDLISFRRLPSFASMHHFTHISPAPILCIVALTLGCHLEN